MSREKKFTKGKWEAARNNCHAGSIATIHHCIGNDWVEIWSEDWPMVEETQEANANLMLSSPKLLEALEDLQKQIQQVRDGDRPYTGFDTELMDAAIAKAYGEQS